MNKKNSIFIGIVFLILIISTLASVLRIEWLKTGTYIVLIIMAIIYFFISDNDKKR